MMSDVLAFSAINGILLVVAYHFLRHYLTSYIDQKAKNLATKEDARAIAAESERGKNLATKEDVAEITKLIEGVKTEHALLIEEARHQNSLRNAIVERRMDAHQQAYALWQRLRTDCHGDCSTLVEECHKWWDRNCLFLDEQPRADFRLAIWCASVHRMAIEQDWERPLIKENWGNIERAGQSIVRAANLPGLVKAETDELSPKAKRATDNDRFDTPVL